MHTCVYVCVYVYMSLVSGGLTPCRQWRSSLRREHVNASSNMYTCMYFCMLPILCCWSACPYSNSTIRYIPVADPTPPPPLQRVFFFFACQYMKIPTDLDPNPPPPFEEFWPRTPPPLKEFLDPPLYSPMGVT